MQHEPPAKADVEEPVSNEEAAGGSVGTDESEAEESAPEETAAQTESEEVEVEDPPEPTLEEQVEQWKDRAMRSAAELDNYRKRMAREKVEDRRYATQGLLEEQLPVLDNFEMGLQAASEDKESMIYRGMEMVKKQLDEFLSSQGVEEIQAEGEIFDPSLHEAVSQEECTDSEEGRILRVIRGGYRMSERLLRPANVVVARAPESDEVPAPAEEEENK